MPARIATHFRFVLGSAAVCLAAVGCDRGPTPPTVDRSVPAGEVSVAFQYADGSVETVAVDGVRSGETVIDVMRRIDDPEISIQGESDMALVTRIGRQSNSGSEGWTFFVNDQWADRSAGTYVVAPGDQIVWKFGGTTAAP